MNIHDLQRLANDTRFMRESGITLLIASCILALFIFIPAGSKQPVSVPITIENFAAPNAFTGIPLKAEAAIVYDIATGETLYAKNANAQLPLASLTKLLTVYAALRELSPTTPITIPLAATQLEDSHVFNEGHTFSLYDLARLTLTASLNDGAAAIASAVAERGNRTQTEMLASAAASLGLFQTYAIDGSGLDLNTVVSGGYGSALDAARLAGAIVGRSSSVAFATTQSFAEAVSAEGTPFSVKNTNPMIDTVPRLLLSKTGYTDLANGNLVLVFDAGILRPIAVVVLGSSQKARFTDGYALVAASLAHFADVASL